MPMPLKKLLLQLSERDPKIRKLISKPLKLKNEKPPAPKEENHGNRR